MATRRKKATPADVHATLYDFRDLDIMFRIEEASNGKGVSSYDVAEMLGLPAEEGGTQAIGRRLAWMRQYEMVAYDPDSKLWRLSRSGGRITAAHLRAPALKVIEDIPDESMVEVMALVTSRFQRGETALGHMLRREFKYATGLR